ncbi:hypothetical protein BDY19DRAFT_968331 [Irpex rosettiformis]|uniref:Uncharacterized protein n=1 Tax=Irpex rosettiformis TaxID=378272 RepID=A0ACB8TSM0_9APHY|nr:hypothetical protein BDY19DRAFT_968331 [Irpex rosettiformis]
MDQGGTPASVFLPTADASANKRKFATDIENEWRAGHHKHQRPHPTTSIFLYSSPPSLTEYLDDERGLAQTYSGITANRSDHPSPCRAAFQPVFSLIGDSSTTETWSIRACGCGCP